MRFDDPAWKEAPVRTGLRVLASLVRKQIGPLRVARVPYDDGHTFIYADLGTPLGLRLYRYGTCDPDIALAKRLLSPGDVFVDGGANVGLFSLAAASKVGPGGKVIAFEPARDVRLSLVRNVALNRLVQVEVMPFALSAAPGEAAFQTFEAAAAGLSHLGPTDGEGGTIEHVKLTTLDAAIGPSDRRRLVLMKLDLEGSEHAALQGAVEILRDARPDLIIEIEDPHLKRLGSSVADVAALLESHRYRLFQVRQNVDRRGAGELTLSPVRDLTAKSGPNVFATTDTTRIQSKGVRLNSDERTARSANASASSAAATEREGAGSSRSRRRASAREKTSRKRSRWRSRPSPALLSRVLASMIASQLAFVGAGSRPSEVPMAHGARGVGVFPAHQDDGSPGRHVFGKPAG